MTHRPHPIDGEWAGDNYADPTDAILFDRCDRCREQAAHPLAMLDVATLGDLWQRMIEVERWDHRHYASAAEANAARHLYGIAVFLERATGVDPWTWPLECS